MDNPQEYSETSRLFLLPVELRQMIYTELFSSTEVYTWQPKEPSWPKSSADSLAILRVCKLINAEIGSSWLSQVSFSYRGTEHLLEKLSPLPRATLEKIRYISIADERPMFKEYMELDVYDRGYQLLWALRFLPGLRLDVLTVMDDYEAEETYNSLDSLVKYGHGWKTLYFFTDGSRMLGFKRTDQYQLSRKPQPGSWWCDLAKRDGASANSGLFVKISRAISTRPGVIYEDFGTLPFGQFLSPSETMETFGLEEDAYLMQKGEAEKDLIVTVRRGKDADLGDMPDISSLEVNMDEWPGDQTWEQIKEEFGLWPFSERHDLYSEASVEDLGVFSWKRHERFIAMLDLLGPPKHTISVSRTSHRKR